MANLSQLFKTIKFKEIIKNIDTLTILYIQKKSF